MAQFQIVPGRGRVRVDGNPLGAITFSSGSSNNRRTEKPMSNYDRTKAQVYATGNRWAIENFEATHN